ncbi:MAG: DUF975 family protein [Kiritimatiellae bacterium]|nr:DUF975 family protein [Kiritimatiellia bacterium]
MNWFYVLNNAQQGPVPASTIRQLLSMGVITLDTLVWADGLPSWIPLRDALSQMDDATAAPAATPVPPPAGNATDSWPDDLKGPGVPFAKLKDRALHGPNGNYWTFFGFFIVSMLIGIAFSFVPVVNFLSFLITAPLTYGAFNLSLRGADHKQLSIGDGFIGFSQYGRALGYYLLTMIFIFLWSLLLIIPGIIKAFSYAMTPYILLDHPEMGVNEAITESRRIMDGHKWELFCLHLSFIGWMLLSILTFGILFFWLNPYMSITTAAFYRSLPKDPPPAPVAS